MDRAKEAGAGTTHIVVMGVSGSGKSTIGRGLSERLGWPFADADDHHPPANIAKMAAGISLTDDDRLPWLEALATWTATHHAAGTSTVLACSALKRAHRDILRQIPRTWFLHLVGTRAMLADRVGARDDHFFPATLLQSQLDSLEPLADDEEGISLSVGPPAVEVIQSALDALSQTVTAL